MCLARQPKSGINVQTNNRKRGERRAERDGQGKPKEKLNDFANIKAERSEKKERREKREREREREILTNTWPFSSMVKLCP